MRRKDGLLNVRGQFLVAVSGMGSAAAAQAAAALAQAGVTGLVSWGFAGGLDPALEAGTMCLPHTIVTLNGTRHATTEPWRERVRSMLRGAVVVGTMLTAEAPLIDAASKARAFLSTGAHAVDMESAAIARIARLHALPCISVRAIVDTAVDGLPQAVLASGSSGQVRIAALLRGLMRSPVEVASVIRLAGRYRLARSTLREAARAAALAATPAEASTVAR